MKGLFWWGAVITGLVHVTAGQALESACTPAEIHGPELAAEDLTRASAARQHALDRLFEQTNFVHLNGGPPLANSKSAPFGVLIGLNCLSEEGQPGRWFRNTTLPAFHLGSGWVLVHGSVALRKPDLRIRPENYRLMYFDHKQRRLAGAPVISVGYLPKAADDEGLSKKLKVWAGMGNVALVKVSPQVAENWDAVPEVSVAPDVEPGKFTVWAMNVTNDGEELIDPTEAMSFRYPVYESGDFDVFLRPYVCKGTKASGRIEFKSEKAKNSTINETPTPHLLKLDECEGDNPPASRHAGALVTYGRSLSRAVAIFERVLYSSAYLGDLETQPSFLSSELPQPGALLRAGLNFTYVSPWGRRVPLEKDAGDRTLVRANALMLYSIGENQPNPFGRFFKMAGWSENRRE